ncbi:roadblock/LC7 domain-containing protein [Candidatus Methylacidiphilum infernorum]|uniref:Roadblock/LC7 domain-containing protein n=1 Tax=Candidatus Methylacidiphilum infernorum TaxID=511746 RepID=A0ABX7PSP1_9BACT|nr:roadblock/LC7 domain-containing protein [Candidatus Methylacidiphilum infernorum]QSR85932.1 roadblock/LC7 domain-containing protein [Candidatus Methylacidiphilum infernorum]
MSISEELNMVLGSLRSAVPEINAALIATTDGLPVAHSLSSGDPNRLSAMAATALGLGKRICETYGGGEFRENTVSGSEGQMFIYSAGGKAVLGVITKTGGNVGLIHLEAREAANKIAMILSRGM